jgi:hypothetical protein
MYYITVYSTNSGNELDGFTIPEMEEDSIEQYIEDNYPDVNEYQYDWTE